MRRGRWIIDPRRESPKPVIYHCVNRVVERGFVFGDVEREKQRMYMRMYENFSGNRVLAYCFMSNHFHVLLEVTAMPAGGLSDAELLERLGAIQSEAQVAEVAAELQEARERIGSRAFVNEAFANARDRFSPARKDGARTMRGSAAAAKGILWSARDLRVEIGGQGKY